MGQTELYPTRLTFELTGERFKPQNLEQKMGNKIATKDRENVDTSESTLNELLSDVFLSRKSLEYIKSIFDRYTETNTLPDVIESVVIHMYPKEDTTPNDEDLNGYEDAIFAEVKIYMPKIKKMFVVPRLCDAVFVAKRSNVRIFKDGSTCISVEGKLNIDVGQSIYVEVVDR